MTRRSRDELHQLMIDAGCELLAERGLAFDPPNLTYANVFTHIEQTQGVRLHRSQVHGRIWDSQDHFRVDVAAAVISDAAPGSAEVDQLVKDLAAPGQSTRVRALANAWISASNEASREVADLDLRFDLLVAAQALSAIDSATAPEIAEAARENLLRRTKHNEHRYEQVAENLGVSTDDELGLAPEATWSILARTSSSLLEGVRLLEDVDRVFTAPFDIIDDDGNPQSRDAAALGLCLIVEQLFGLEDESTDDDDAEHPWAEGR